MEKTEFNKPIYRVTIHTRYWRNWWKNLFPSIKTSIVFLNCRAMTSIMALTTWSSCIVEGWQTSFGWGPTRHPTGAQILQILSYSDDALRVSRHEGPHAGKEGVRSVQNFIFAIVFAVSNHFFARAFMQPIYLKQILSANIKL